MNNAVSWSEMLTFMECQRKWQLRYQLGIEPVSGDDVLARFLGSAFHAGISKFIVTGNVDVAIDAAKEYIDENTRTAEGQSDYYDMINEAHNAVWTMLSYYLPRLEIGTKYRPVQVGEIFPDAPDAYNYMVEWSFYTHDDKPIKGAIDAILYDLETEEYVLVDWKTRSSFPFEDAAHLDGQLHLYIAALKSMTDAPLNRAIMWQFKVRTPQPASISKVSGLPNTGAASYDTTWEQWCKTLPAGIKAERFEALMKPKLKTDDEFMRKTELIITPMSVERTKRTTQGIISAMDFARERLDSGDFLPAVQSVHTCKMCPFFRLCGGVLRYGGNFEEALALNYKQKET